MLVMLCSWEGNRMSGIASDVRQRFDDILSYGLRLAAFEMWVWRKVKISR